MFLSTSYFLIYHLNLFTKSKSPSIGEEKLIIGVIISRTNKLYGEYNDLVTELGIITLNSINSAFEMINNQDNNFKKIELSIIDSECGTQDLKKKFKSLIKKINVRIIIGDVCSHVNFKILEADTKSTFLLMSTGGIRDFFTHHKDYFRIFKSEKEYNNAYYNVLNKYIENFPQTEVVIISSESNISSSIIEDFSDRPVIFGNLSYLGNNRFIINETFIVNIKFATNIITTKFLSNELNNDYTNNYLILRDAFHDLDDYLALSNNNNIYLIDTIDYDKTDLQTFAEQFLEKDLYSDSREISLTYDLYNLFKTLNLAESKEEIRNQLLQSVFDSSSGDLTFDSSGDVIRDFHFYVINDKDVTKVQKMGPYKKIILIV